MFGGRPLTRGLIVLGGPWGAFQTVEQDPVLVAAELGVEMPPGSQTGSKQRIALPASAQDDVAEHNIEQFKVERGLQVADHLLCPRRLGALVEDKVNLNAAETDAVCTKNFLQSAFVGLFIKCIRLDQIGHQF